MHAVLSDRELNIHSHHPGQLVKLTERFCHPAINMKLIRTPIRPIIERRSLVFGCSLFSNKLHTFSAQVFEHIGSQHGEKIIIINLFCGLSSSFYRQASMAIMRQIIEDIFYSMAS